MDQQYIDKLIKRDTAVEHAVDDKGWIRCPACNEMLYAGSFCRFCGQRIKPW